MDELSNIAPRFVELTVTLWAQTHWDDRQAYARQTVKWTKAAEKDSYWGEHRWLLKAHDGIIKGFSMLTAASKSDQ